MQREEGERTAKDDSKETSVMVGVVGKCEEDSKSIVKTLRSVDYENRGTDLI